VGYLEVDLPLTLKMHGKERLLPVVETAGKEAKATIQALRDVPPADLDRRLAALDARLATVLADVQVYLREGPRAMTPSDLPPVIRDTFYRRTADGEKFAVRIYPTGSVTDREFTARFREFTLSVDPDVTGVPITFLAWGILFVEGLERAAVIAVLAIFLLVLYDFRRLDDTLLAMFPLLLGAVWMVGFMNALGIEYNFGNVVAIPLILGIGIDSGVHVVHRWRQGTPASDLASTTGKPVLISSLTTILAFGALMISDHLGAQSLGMVLVIGVASCLATATLFLPAVLALLERLRRPA
jgi:predicted RND superfamily exporter protein